MLQLNLLKNIKEKPFDECYVRVECKKVKNRIQYHHCNQTNHSLLPTLEGVNNKNIFVANSFTRCVRRSVLCRFSFRCWCHDICRDMQRKRKEEGNEKRQYQTCNRCRNSLIHLFSSLFLNNEFPCIIHLIPSGWLLIKNSDQSMRGVRKAKIDADERIK